MAESIWCQECGHRTWWRCRECRCSMGARARRGSQTGRRTWRAWIVAGCPPCHYCALPLGVDRPPTLDHKHPVALGGTRDRGNLVVACALCNRAKGAAHYDAYMREVHVARRRAAAENREYRRPKWRLTASGGHEITHATRAETRDRRDSPTS